MRLLILSIFLIVQILGSKTCNAQGVGTFQWTNGAPNNNPGLSGAKFAVDKNSYRWYEWVSGTSWVQCGDRIQQISGCAAPAYTPTIHNAYFVVNGCTSPEFYYWNGTAWKLLNGGATYTAGSGIAISGGNVISADTSILATQYDISQLGVTWPLLAPTSTTPNYSFENSPMSGLFYENTSTPTIGIVGAASESSFGTSIDIISGSGSVGGTLRLLAGDSDIAGESGGSFILQAGNSTNTTDGLGGTAVFSGGNSASSDTGGQLNLAGGVGTQGRGRVQIALSPFSLAEFSTVGREIYAGERAMIWNSEKKTMEVHDGTAWYEMQKTIKASATLNFPSTPANSSSDLTITVTGAAVGDAVTIAPGVAAIVANSCYTAWVSAANTVTIRFNNYNTAAAADPASATFNVIVTKF